MFPPGVSEHSVCGHPERPAIAPPPTGQALQAPLTHPGIPKMSIKYAETHLDSGFLEHTGYCDEGERGRANVVVCMIDTSHASHLWIRWYGKG